MQQLDIATGPVHNLSHFIEFVSSCDQIILNHPKPLHYIELEQSSPTPQCDFVLIGSKALNYHWQQKGNALMEGSSCSLPIRTSTWTRKIMKKWSEERFNRKSDWDLICLNRDALVHLLKSKEFKEISVNYAIYYKLKEKHVENSDFMDWILDGGQPRRWIEFSVRLEQFDGEIIEIEYCTDHYHLSKYLEMKNVEEFKVENLPASLKDSSLSRVGIAPLQLLEIIKKSHLQFNIDSDNWFKHIFDVELIHLILPPSEQYHEESLIDSINNTEGLVHYDRLTKRIVKLLQDEEDDDLHSNLQMYMFYREKDGFEVDRVVRTTPLSEEMLSNAFGVSLIFRRAYSLSNNFESLTFISQQVAANLLTSVVRSIDSEYELERLVFQSVRNAIEENFDTFLYSIARDNFMKISEMAFKMLNHLNVFKELFETNVEMKLVTFSNTPIDFENDNVKEISSKDGATLSHYYLPIEIIMNIASFISKANDFTNLLRLDKSWNNVFESNDVWKYLYFCSYPTPSHYSTKSNFNAGDDWKNCVLSRSRFERIPFPTAKKLEYLSNAFKAKFIRNSTIFKHFVNDFFNNTYIVSKELNDDQDNEYKTLTTYLITYWPRQSPLKYKMEFTLDLAVYRPGDSKCGARETVSCTLFNSDYEHFSSPLKISKFAHPQNFIGKYYLENMKPDQYAPLFSTLLALGLLNNEFIFWVLKNWVE